MVAAVIVVVPSIIAGVLFILFIRSELLPLIVAIVVVVAHIIVKILILELI